jgi:hypothetical protein
MYRSHGLLRINTWTTQRSFGRVLVKRSLSTPFYWAGLTKARTRFLTADLTVRASNQIAAISVTVSARQTTFAGPVF